MLFAYITDINVLERYILYTNNTSICGISINVLNIPDDLLTPACDIIQHNKPITKFAVDMMSNMIFYTDGNDIFKDIAFSQNPEHLGSANDVTGIQLQLCDYMTHLQLPNVCMSLWNHTLDVYMFELNTECFKIKKN